jgi:tRNA A-37 threonylcarbamoyl transferase component Bud32
MSSSLLKPIELSQDSYDRLIHNSIVLERDKRADKVLQLADGSFLKLFRKKSFFSSATIQPYSRRFIVNASGLQSNGIPTINPVALFNIPPIAHTAVHYKPLPGKTLRQVANEHTFDFALAQKLGEFVATLHHKGVYFRSLHLGNIVLTPEGSMGLIDIADMSVGKRSLRTNKRIRNFRHMLRYSEDKKAVGMDCLNAMVDAYIENTELSQTKNTLLQNTLVTMLQPSPGD